MINIACVAILGNSRAIKKNTCDSLIFSVLAEDAIKAALADYKVKQSNADK